MEEVSEDPMWGLESRGERGFVHRSLERGQASPEEEGLCVEGPRERPGQPSPGQN